MTPVEDHISRSLSLAGWSFREIAELLGRSDKTIAMAIDRAEENNGAHPLLQMSSKKAVMEALRAQDKKLLRNITEFTTWLQEGEEAGYVAALVRLLGY
jgi:IS30 family transposase